MILNILIRRGDKEFVKLSVGEKPVVYNTVSILPAQMIVAYIEIDDEQEFARIYYEDTKANTENVISLKNCNYEILEVSEGITSMEEYRQTVLNPLQAKEESKQKADNDIVKVKNTEQ